MPHCEELADRGAIEPQIVEFRTVSDFGVRGPGGEIKLFPRKCTTLSWGHGKIGHGN